MFNQIRVYSLFDPHQIKLCRDEGINHFGVDYRPREFSFVQHATVMEMLSSVDASECSFYFRFGNERPEVWQVFVDDFLKVLDQGRMNLVFDELRGWSTIPYQFELEKVHYELRNPLEADDALIGELKDKTGDIILNLLSYTSSFRVIDEERLIRDLRMLMELKKGVE